MGKNHLTAAGPIWKLFLPFLSLERWTCQFLSIYRGKGLSIASEAEKAFREREGERERGREGGFLHSFFLFLCLTFFPSSSWPARSQHTGRERSSFKSFLLVLSYVLRTTRSLMELHVPQSPGRAEGGCQGQAKLLLPDRCRPLDSSQPQCYIINRFYFRIPSILPRGFLRALADSYQHRQH